MGREYRAGVHFRVHDRGVWHVEHLYLRPPFLVRAIPQKLGQQ